MTPRTRDLSLEELVEDHKPNMSVMVDNFPIEYIPLTYLFEQMPDSTVDSIYRKAHSIESDFSRPPEPKPYDRWTGTGEVEQRTDPYEKLVETMFGALRDGGGALLALAVPPTKAADLLPTVAIWFLAEGYLKRRKGPIDPNKSPYAERNYWQDLSGAAAWPPRR